jgi:hypothetical protein
MCGFRGEHGTRTPWEIFPIWCGNKSPGTSTARFFADGRGPRVPIASTVPIGYEMPKPQMTAPLWDTPSGAPAGEEFSRTRIGFSVGTDYYNTGKMGANWGTGIPSR